MTGHRYDNSDSPPAPSVESHPLSMRQRERCLALLSMLGQQLTAPTDFEEAARVSLDTAMELTHSNLGTLLLLHPLTRSATQGIEVGLSTDFVVSHVIPEVLQRYERSPMSARHPWFRTCRCSDISKLDVPVPTAFRTVTIPLFWDNDLKGVLVTVGPIEPGLDNLMLEALQSLVTTALSLRERFDPETKPADDRAQKLQANPENPKD